MRVNAEDTEWDESLLVTYRGQPYTGERVETDGDGRTTGLAGYVDGQQHGIERRWYPNGRLKAELTVDMGRLVGVARYWHENGELSEEDVFDARGNLVEVRQWDENGVPERRSRRAGTA